MSAAGAHAITLVRLAEQHRAAFLQEEVANYAQQQIRDAGWPRSEALDRARAALLPVLERELAEAARQGHALWSAVTADGVAVGCDELLLHVNVGNLPARRLYTAAGYEQVEEDQRVCRLRKRLGGAL